jgi:outer membrane murein-binding lipoprotein Lpp
MKKKWIAIIVAAVLLGGCASSQPVNNSKQSDISPLTGVESTDTDRRAVAVVISNHPAARPQTSLEEADIVYEMLTEGGITRFLAIYQSEYPEFAGPVRSARDYFVELAVGYDSLFLAHGYSPEAKEMLFDGKVDQLNGIQDGDVFKRDAARQAPHNSYVYFEEAMEMAKEKAYNVDSSPVQLSFLTKNEEESLNGEPASTVVIHSSKNESFDAIYEYDEESESYNRTIDGADMKADNIFVVEADHRVVDAAGRLDIDLTSGGDAFLIQRGIMNMVKWQNNNGRIVPYTESGAALKTGKTWIHVVPASRGLNKAVNVENEGEGNER